MLADIKDMMMAMSQAGGQSAGSHQVSHPCKLRWAFPGDGGTQKQSATYEIPVYSQKPIK
jgi:hypothetical protein